MLARLVGARMSAVNHAEVLTKLVDKGEDAAAMRAFVAELDLDVLAFDRAQAEMAASGALDHGVDVELVQ